MDMQFTNHGSIWIMTPLSEGGRDWIAQHIAEDATRWGQNGVVIEHRYVANIVEGVRGDGLEISAF